MEHDFSLILEDCLQRLQQGESLEACLERYPEQAQQLQPLLRAASRLHSAPSLQPRPEAIQAGRNRMLVAADRLMKTAQKPWIVWNLAFQLAMLFVAIIVIGGIFTVNASAKSLPGDLLYPVKRNWEAVRLGFTINPQSRQSLETHFSQERLEEIQRLVQLGRQETIEISGILQSIQPDTWTISGLMVFVTPATLIEGKVEIDSPLTMQVQVRSDGQLFAVNAVFHQSSTARTSTATASHTPSPANNPPPTLRPTATYNLAPTATLLPPDEDDREPTDELEETDEPDETEALEPTEDDAEATDEVEPTDEHEETDEMEPTGTPEPVDNP